MGSLEELNSLLDRLTPDDGLASSDDVALAPFVGILVSEKLRRARYPVTWLPLIERYVSLSTKSETDANVKLYCDLACTVITKKLFMVDIYYLFRPPPADVTNSDEDNDSDGNDNNEDEEERLREAHMITATKYLVKMLTCICECVCGRLPNRVDTARAASLLYAELYGEAFDPHRAGVREKDIFRVVHGWFRAHVLRTDPVNVAPGVPFLACSHVYWLWLHLTAARVRHSSQDLLTVIYALDLIVYCAECKNHFLDHRKQFFFKDPDRDGIPTCIYDNERLLIHLHNRINVQTGSTVVEDEERLLAEYQSFWKRYESD